MSAITDRYWLDQPYPPAQYRHSRNSQLYVLCNPSLSKTSRWWAYGQTYALPANPTKIAGWFCGERECDKFVVISREAAFMAHKHLKLTHAIGKSSEQQEEEVEDIVASAVISSQPEVRG